VQQSSSEQGLVVKGNKVAATLPSGKVGQTVLEKKKGKQTQIQEILHFMYMHLAHYKPNKKKFIKTSPY